MKHWLFLLACLACWQCANAPQAEKPPPGYGVTPRDSPDAAFWSFWLDLFNEPVLSEKHLGHDMIRLSYTGFITHPTCIVLHREADSVWVETKRFEGYKISNGKMRQNHLDDLKPAHMITFRYLLHPADWQRMDSLLTANSFWQMQFEINKDVLDGQTFLLEAHCPDRYHAAGGWQPDERFYQLCLHLIRLAGMKDESDTYGIPCPN